MKQILITSLALLSLLSFSALADFNIPGKATITYPTGVTKQVDLSFAFKPIDGQQHFVAGKLKMATSAVPERYSVSILLTKQGEAWVQEFGQGYFSEFDYQLGDYNIQLKKTDRDVKGNYLLVLNGKNHLFDTNTVQLIVKFNDEGIEGLQLEGSIKDMQLQME